MILLGCTVLTGNEGQMTQAKKNPFDYYTVYARMFPAIISALPLFVLWYFMVPLGELSGLMSYILSLRFLKSITLGVVFLYFFAQLIRTASKLLEKQYFLHGKGFPTTYLMLYGDNTFSRDYKDAYRKRVGDLSEMALPTEEDEVTDLAETQKRLTEVTKFVILRVGRGQLVFKHNVWYGFFRNLVGGAFFALAFCMLNVVIGAIILENSTLWVSSLVLMVCFAFILLWRRPILVQHAEAYAKQLIAEFIAMGNPDRPAFSYDSGDKTSPMGRGSSPNGN